MLEDRIYELYELIETKVKEPQYGRLVYCRWCCNELTRIRVWLTVCVVA